jgi:hypothetical protein
MAPLALFLGALGLERVSDAKCDLWERASHRRDWCRVAEEVRLPLAGVAHGFGAPGTFGGVIPTPALDRIANSGLRYTNFHSTSLCSPTRAALITARI